MRILQISPGFHGYWRSTERALEARGHEVVTHVYDARPTVGARLTHKLTHELPERLGADRRSLLVSRSSANALAALRANRPDAVLVIKGDVFDASFWAEVQRLPHVLWLYDEVRRTGHSIPELVGLGPVATYSAHDAAALGAAGATVRHVPLAYDPGIRAEPSHGRNDQIVFVGARYPTRETLLTGLVDRRVGVTAYGRDWSHHPVDRARTWDPRRPPIASGRDLSRETTYRVMADAAGTLNIHGDQDGFTMRTFEACGVGALQLIDRHDVGEVYEPDHEVVVFDDLDHLAELCRRAISDRRWSDRIREGGRRRTLAEHTFGHRVAMLEEMWA